VASGPLRIGEASPRFEDDALLRGRAVFTGDARLPDEAAMVLVRAQRAAGTVRSVDAGEAAAMRGVLAVLTPADAAADGLGSFLPRLRHPGPDGGEMRVPPFPPLAVEIRHVGAPVAAVVATTQAQAEDAAERVAVEVSERPAVTDPLAAIAPDAPRVWDAFPDNRCFRVEKGDAAAVAQALARAAHVVRRRLRITRVTAAPLEPRGALAVDDPATGGYRLEIGTQAPHRLAPDLEIALGLPAGSVRVVARACGGSFGMRNIGYPEYALALWAARRTGRPVRWTATRLESFAADAHGRDQWADAALALDADGRFLALDVRIVAGLGAHAGPMTPHPSTANLGGLAGVYRIPAIRAAVDGVFTCTQQTAPYRGAGRPEATYVVERMIDEAARELGIDRVALRRLNMVGPGEMPWRTGFVFTYDSGDFPAVMDRTLALGDAEGFAARRAASRARGLLRGLGIANPIEIAGGPPGKPHAEFARLSLAPTGRLRVLVGAADTGQGHGSAFRRILGERLGVAPQDVEVVAGDTGVVPRGTGSFGSRTMGAAGTALAAAAERLVERLRPAAADLLEAAAVDVVFADGAFAVVGTDRRVALADVARALAEPAEAEAETGARDATFPNACHLCEVEIDPETGRVRVDRYAVVDDVGTVIDPMSVKGQIHGGIAQGLGQALMEETVHDPRTGQLLTATFADYAMPRADDLPSIAVESLPVPTAANPLGAKGVGEAGTVGALAAVMSAVNDALASAGAAPVDMPATAERVWRSLRRASREGASGTGPLATGPAGDEGAASAGGLPAGPDVTDGRT
jgi:carbon-monoxide dehydrogenase large subunit